MMPLESTHTIVPVLSSATASGLGSPTGREPHFDSTVAVPGKTCGLARHLKVIPGPYLPQGHKKRYSKTQNFANPQDLSRETTRTDALNG